MKLTDLGRCPNPKCVSKHGHTRSDFEILEKYSKGVYKAQIACRDCGFSSGWWEDAHELMAWWNKWAAQTLEKGGE